MKKYIHVMTYIKPVGKNKTLPVLMVTTSDKPVLESGHYSCTMMQASELTAYAKSIGAEIVGQPFKQVPPEFNLTEDYIAQLKDNKGRAAWETDFKSDVEQLGGYPHSAPAKDVFVQSAGRGKRPHVSAGKRIDDIISKIPVKTKPTTSSDILPSSACMRDAKKALGIAPYNQPGNHLVGDGYFSKSCIDKYGQRQWDRACRLLRGE